jgi:hypothetical protein
MDTAPSVILEQLLNRTKRHYAGNAKHGDGAKGGGAGRQGARMTLSDADAQKALAAADYDEADFQTLKSNRGPEKAPKLWWFDRATGILYCFHHHGGHDWHGFPEDKGRPPQAILRKWLANETLTKKQYREIIDRPEK